MPNDESVTRWIFDLRTGDEEAAGHLWQRYYRRMASLAQKHLRHHPNRAGDEEDVAISAFESFVRRSSEGKLNDLQDRGELWRLLAVITKRKALNQIRHEKAEKRGGEKMHWDGDLAEVFRDEPTPQQTAELLDEVQRLMNVVLSGEDQLRFIVLRKLGGEDTREIAAALNCAQRTVQRKLERIYILWEADLNSRA